MKGCEVCGEPLTYGERFCSYRCYAEFRSERPIARWAESDECEMCGQDDCDCPQIVPMTPEQMVAEMEGVFARLAAYGEEDGG